MQDPTLKPVPARGLRPGALLVSGIINIGGALIVLFAMDPADGSRAAQGWALMQFLSGVWAGVLGANSPFAVAFYPQIGAMNRWMFGVSLGGGLEFPFSELVGGQLTVSLHPDLTLQYNQPASPPLINPVDPGGPPIIIGERRIRNLALEISLGIRLLRKVVYVDE